MIVAAARVWCGDVVDRVLCTVDSEAFWLKVDNIVKERRETIQAMSAEERLSEEEVCVCVD